MSTTSDKQAAHAKPRFGGSWRWRCLALIAAVTAWPLAASTGAYSYTVDSLYRAGDFATSFPSAPTAAATGPTGNIYVGDAEGQIYVFGPNGGDVSTAKRLTTESLGRLSDLVFTSNGHLYASRFNGGPLKTGDVVELDPSTGAIKRKVAEGLDGAEGLRQDPISGDLFVAQANEHNDIWRIAGLESTMPSKTLYNNGTSGPYMAGFTWPDGIAFGQRGALLLADAGSDNNVFTIGATNTSQPAAISIVASMPTPSGPRGLAAFPGFVLVDRADGTIARIDLTVPARTQTIILSGGNSGGLMAIGPEGCVYASESDRVIKLTNADGSCPLIGHAPPVQPTPGPGTGDTTHHAPSVTPNPVDPPVIEALRISPSRIRAASGGPSAILARHRQQGSIGARVYYTLSKLSTVRFQIERIVAGRLDAQGRCRRAPMHGRRGSPCIQYLPLHGVMTINGEIGENTFKFMGRLAHKKLRRGQYRLVATPYFGHRGGASASASFSVVG